jgi:nucleotide-binding universal stress UspA family protein
MALFTTDNVLVPIDFSEASQKALDDTLEFVGDPTKIHVIHVLHPLEPMAPGVIWDTVDDPGRMANVQSAFQKLAAEKSYGQMKFTVTVGSPSSEIIDYAEKNSIDLIVIPSHGRTGLSRFLLGSVAERVIRFSKCPVVVLRH